VRIFITAFCLSVIFIAKGQPKKTTVPKSRVAPPTVQRGYTPPSLKDDPTPVKYIDPKPDTTTYTPVHFYVAGVIDATGTNDSIGFTLQPRSGKPQKLSFKEGTAAFFRNYTNKILKRDTTLYPLVLVVKELSVSDERYKNLGDETTIKYRLQFISVYKHDTIEVSTYSGQRFFRTMLGDKKAYDSMLDRTNIFWPHVDEAFSEILDKHPTFCKGVKVNVHVRTEAATADSVFYDGQRQLTWDDYRGEAESTDGILSYIMVDYDGNTGYEKAYAILDIYVATAFVKKESWVNGRMQKPETLAHDNYKFKLAYLYMLRLKKELESAQFTYENYQTGIQAAYKKTQKEANAEFSAYDKESAYGTRKKEQLRWQQTIDAAIAELQ
jgi:hypothetical protein